MGKLFCCSCCALIILTGCLVSLFKPENATAFGITCTAMVTLMGLWMGFIYKGNKDKLEKGNVQAQTQATPAT